MSSGFAASVAAALVAAAPSAVLGAADEGDPLQCWWRTSAGAVRVGERFSAVLTCAARETPEATVVVDRSRLEPVAARLPPFEVLGGTAAPDLATPTHRFFQYEYELRLIDDVHFGRDVALPGLPLTYRIRRSVPGQEAAVEGAAQHYELPPAAVRILSIVPDTARDIRDATPATFAALDADRVRADLLVRAGMVASALAAALAIAGLARLAGDRRGGPRPAARPLTPAIVLRSAARELGAVARARAAGGWSDALVARALAAARVAAACALDREVPQRPIDPRAPLDSGSMPAGRRFRRPVAVSAATTPAALARAARAEGPGAPALAALADALDAFTRSRYGAGGPADGAGGPADGNGAGDDTRLDRALAAARDAVRGLRAARRLPRRAAGALAGRLRAWSR